MEDPPVAAAVESNSDDDSSDGICPPSPSTGLNLLLSANTEVQEVAFMMDLPRDEPGLFRFTDNTNKMVPFQTRIAVLNFPRRLNLWVADFSVYERLAEKIRGLEHAEWPLLSEQTRLQTFTVRLYVHYKSLFQCLEDSDREIQDLRHNLSELELRVRSMESLLRGFFSTSHLNPAPTIVAPAPATAWSQPTMSQDDPDDLEDPDTDHIRYDDTF